MPRGVFLKLCGWLEEDGYLNSTRYIAVTEQAGMFVWADSHNGSNRTVQERFQQSGDTVSR